MNDDIVSLTFKQNIVIQRLLYFYQIYKVAFMNMNYYEGIRKIKDYEKRNNKFVKYKNMCERMNKILKEIQSKNDFCINNWKKFNDIEFELEKEDDLDDDLIEEFFELTNSMFDPKSLWMPDYYHP